MPPGTGAASYLALHDVKKHTSCKAALVCISAEHEGKAGDAILTVIIKSIAAGADLLSGFL